MSPSITQNPLRKEASRILYNSHEQRLLEFWQRSI